MPMPTDELVLEPPTPVSAVTPQQAATTVRVDEATAARITAAVGAYVDSLIALEAQSPEFDQKVTSISRMGNDEIRRSAQASNRFLERPTVALKEGPLAQGSQVSSALLSLRQQVEALDPSRHLNYRRSFFRKVPFGNQVGEYFRKYQSAQTQIEAVVASLYRGQDELLRDNAALEQERAHLWDMKRRLEQYVYMAGQLDDGLTAKIAETERTDHEKARALK